MEPSLCKLESFEELHKTGLQQVVFRGSLFYKKGMIRKLQKRLPQGAPYDSLRGLSFRIELVLLEVLEVHPQSPREASGWWWRSVREEFAEGFNDPGFLADEEVVVRTGPFFDFGGGDRALEV